MFPNTLRGPIWWEAAKNVKLRQKLTFFHRLVCIRVFCGYRTISGEAMAVVAKLSPLELAAWERFKLYTETPKRDAEEKLLRRWQAQWDQGTYGRRSHRLIPSLKHWIKGPANKTDYYSVQALSGHGCFRQYQAEESGFWQELLLWYGERCPARPHCVRHISEL